MNSKLHKPTATKAELSIELDEQTLAKAKEATLKKLQADVSAPGFRKGKAPLKVVEKQTDSSYLQSQVIDEALNTAYAGAIKEHDLQPLSSPKVDIKAFVPYSSLKATFVFDIVGQIKLPPLSSISVKHHSVSVSDKEVGEVIANLRRRLAEKKLLKREARKGDEVTIDFEGRSEDNKPIAGASGSDYPLIIGSDTFIPGFEDSIEGLKTSQGKEFELKFPADYGHTQLAGKKVTFTVTVKKVSSVTLPKVDAEFCQKVGPFKTPQELKKDIRQQLTRQKEVEEKRRYQDAIIEKIVDRSKLDLPDILVEESIESLLLDFKQNLIYRGVTFEEYLKQIDLSQEEFTNKELRPQAEKRVAAGLVLSEFARQEKIDVTPEELEIRLQLMKGQYQSDDTMSSQIDTAQGRRDIRARLLSEKTLQKIEELVG